MSGGLSDSSGIPDSAQATTSVSIDANLQLKNWDMSPVAPWRRYGARALDTVTNGMMGFFLIGVAWFQIAPLSAEQFFSLFEGKGGRFLDLFFSLIVAGLVNALVLGATGSTLGKVIFGISVARPDGSKLGFCDSLKREVYVWVQGLGFGLPFVSLFTMGFAYRTLKREGNTHWDTGEYRVLYRQGDGQIALNVMGVVLIIAARLVLRALNDL